MNDILEAEIAHVAELPTRETRVMVRPDETGAVPSPVGADLAVIDSDAMTPSMASDINPFAGAGLPFSKEAQDVLRKYHTVPDEWIGIRPEGHIYLTYSRAVDIFDEAFGYGGWSMVPVGDDFKTERQDKTDRYQKPYQLVTVYREYRFIAHGRFVRQAMGAGDYRTNNPQMNLSDAAEMCESYALNRMAKRFRIASQCWDGDYAEVWKAKNATRDGDGNWKKRKPSPRTGAASTSDSSSLSPSAPHHAEPPTESSPDRPPSGAPVLGNHSGLIRLESAGKKWRYQNAPVAMFTDTDGKKWKFVGETVAVAEKALADGVFIGIEWREEVDGKFRNKVVVAAAIPEAGE